MNRKLISKATAAAFAAAVGLQISISVSSEQPFDFDFSNTDMSYEELNNFILGDSVSFTDDGYDAVISSRDSTGYRRAWSLRNVEGTDGYSISFIPNDYPSNIRIKIPDSFKYKRYRGNVFKGYTKATEVKAIEGSCPFKEFDLNPENKYMTLVDNVVFSKDKKTLMSYAQFDERTYYEVPDGTEVIESDSLTSCKNIKEIYIPDTVNDIKHAFSSMDNLEKINIPPLVEEIRDFTFYGSDNLKDVYIPENSKLKKIGGNAFYDTNISELTLPSFEVEICDYAFYGHNSAAVTLKSYVKPELKSEYLAEEKAHEFQWNEIPNALYYEIYQNLGNGEYKKLGQTKSTSHRFKNLKPNYEYTFAVKAFAEIKPFKGGYSEIYHNLPQYFIIEGTMSEDIVVRG